MIKCGCRRDSGRRFREHWLRPLRCPWLASASTPSADQLRRILCAWRRDPSQCQPGCLLFLHAEVREFVLERRFHAAIGRVISKENGIAGILSTLRSPATISKACLRIGLRDEQRANWHPRFIAQFAQRVSPGRLKYPQLAPACSLPTVRASLSSHRPANFECRSNFPVCL